MSTISSSDAQLIEYLNSISAEISRYFSIFIFLTGTIGNILNILTLSQPSLRRIPCVFFFLVSSIASLISVGLGVVTRALSVWTVDPTYTIGWLCKARTFIVFSTRAMVFWLLVAAAINRWLISSTKIHRHQLSTLKNAKRQTIAIIIISLSIHAQLLYCYDANLMNGPFKCYAKNHVCQLVSDLTFVFFTTISPILCMLIFSLMMLSNIRQSRRRVLEGNVITKIQIKTPAFAAPKLATKIERQLLLMLLVQTIVLSVLTLPQAIQRLYVVLTALNQSVVQAAINTFVYNIVLLLTYLSSALPFYIYTLTGGSLFRKALVNTMKSILKTIMFKYRCYD